MAMGRPRPEKRGRRCFRDLRVLPVALALGALMAFVDLNSSERWPAALLSLTFVGALAFAFPRFAWRWALAVLLALLVLPFAVALGFEGPN